MRLIQHHTKSRKTMSLADIMALDFGSPEHPNKTAYTKAEYFIMGSAPDNDRYRAYVHVITVGMRNPVPSRAEFQDHINEMCDYYDTITR